MKMKRKKNRCKDKLATGHPPFFRIPVKQVIAGSNHVFAPGVVLVVFTMKYMKGLKVYLVHCLHGDYYSPHTSAIFLY